MLRAHGFNGRRTQKRKQSIRNFTASDGFADLFHFEPMHTGALPRLAPPRCVMPPRAGADVLGLNTKSRAARLHEMTKQFPTADVVGK